MAKNKYFQIGSVLKSKENPKEFYLKLSADVQIQVKDKDGEVIQEISLEAGESLSLQSPQSEIAFLLENEHITEEEAEERLEKVPDFVKYNVKAKVAQVEKKSNSSKNNSKSSSKSSKRNTEDEF